MIVPLRCPGGGVGRHAGWGAKAEAAGTYQVLWGRAPLLQHPQVTRFADDNEAAGTAV